MSLAASWRTFTHLWFVLFLSYILPLSSCRLLKDGMGLLQVHSDGLKLDEGESEFLSPIYAEEIHSREVPSSLTHTVLAHRPTSFFSPSILSSLIRLLHPQHRWAGASHSHHLVPQAALLSQLWIFGCLLEDVSEQTCWQSHPVHVVLVHWAFPLTSRMFVVVYGSQQQMATLYCSLYISNFHAHNSNF